jgi:hypothetical protein
VRRFYDTLAAVATLLSGIIGIGFSAGYVNRLLDVSVPVGEIGRQWIAILAMGVIVYIFRILIENHSIARFNAVYVFLLVAIGAISYFVVLFTLSSQFQLTVKDNIPFNYLF